MFPDEKQEKFFTRKFSTMHTHTHTHTQTHTDTHTHTHTYIYIYIYIYIFKTVFVSSERNLTKIPNVLNYVFGKY